MSRTQQFWHLNRFWNVVGTRLQQKIVHNELSCDGAPASRWELRERLGCSAAEYPDRAQCSCKLEVFQLDSRFVSPPLNVEWTGVKICMTVTDHTDSNLRILDAFRRSGQYSSLKMSHWLCYDTHAKILYNRRTSSHHMMYSVLFSMWLTGVADAPVICR